MRKERRRNEKMPAGRVKEKRGGNKERTRKAKKVEGRGDGGVKYRQGRRKTCRREKQSRN